MFGFRTLYRSLTLLLLATAIAPVGAQDDDGHVVARFDFTHQPDGNAVSWLKENGFEFKLGAKGLNPHFSNNRLVLETESEEAGLIFRELNIAGADRVRITWGVQRYPQGANWDVGNYRVPIAVMISFGHELVESGSIFIPDAPYFVGLFLGNKEQEGRAYTAKYYKKGGRYFCIPCSPPTGKTVTTEFNFDQVLKQEFNVTKSLPVTRFGIQMNTLDTSGGARAFLKSVEFLAPSPSVAYQE